MQNELIPIVADRASDATKPLALSLGGTLSDVWQGIVGDRVQAWRLARAAEVSEKLERKLSKRSMTLKLDQIPERFAYSWFEKATVEDESDIQDLFAELLINAAEGNGAALDRRCLRIISEFTPSDAWNFKFLLEKIFSGGSKKSVDWSQCKDKLGKEGFDERNPSFDSLSSLGLIGFSDYVFIDRIEHAKISLSSDTVDDIGRLSRALKTDRVLRLTGLGVQVARSISIWDGD